MKGPELKYIFLCVVTLGTITHGCLLGSTTLLLCPAQKLVDILAAILRTEGAGVLFDGDVSSNKGPLGYTPASLLAPAASNNFNMYFAGTAYSESTLEDLSCEWCGNITAPTQQYFFYKRIDNFTFNTKAYFAISHLKEEIVLSFRGSLNVPNVIEDLVSVQARTGGNVRIHRGFYRATQSLYPEVLANLQNLTTVYSDYKVVITGHSLGGAEASIAIYLLTTEPNNPFSNSIFEVYTYGTPRVGNKEFADYMNNLPIVLTRTVAKGDVSAHIPPAAYGYYHAQTEFWSADPVNYPAAQYCNRTNYEDPACSDSLFPFYAALEHPYYFDVNLVHCVAEDPVSFVAQGVFNLNKLLPEFLKDFFPNIPSGIIDADELLQLLTALEPSPSG